MTDLGTALADGIEMVARHRAGLRCKVCSRHGETAWPIYKLTRELLAVDLSADNNPCFQ
jgi:hypothetical protein